MSDAFSYLGLLSPVEILGPGVSAVHRIYGCWYRSSCFAEPELRVMARNSVKPGSADEASAWRLQDQD